MDKQLIVALDFPTAEQALSFAKKLSPKQVRLKIGKELFVTHGPNIVESIQSLGFDVFLDLKFHDIPNTVANACLSAAKMGVWMINVHASGGQKMMEEAVSKLTALPQRPLLTAVTVLTSMDEQMLFDIGVERTLKEQVSYLAKLAKKSGLDGIVCSAQEALMLRQLFIQPTGSNDYFNLVTPGIRLASDSLDDQKRILTPKQAILDGVDYLVMGRPITSAKDPQLVIDNVYKQITELY